MKPSGKLLPPRPMPVPGAPSRTEWIESVCAGFVSLSEANKSYYRVVLECLWPKGHGLPGPLRTREDIREAIRSYRESIGETKPYQDPFRRVRELQGEEGVIGIEKYGKTYQLQHTRLAAKRVPRTGLSDKDWELVRERDGDRCTVCGRAPPEVKLQQDHRVPRLRGGGDDLDNWQPLCEECNNFKSTFCRGCNQDCNACPWAFPEENALIRITKEISVSLRKIARKSGEDPNDLANRLLESVISKKSEP